MISVSRLYTGQEEPSDVLRYGGRPDSRRERKPVVVWNLTPRCNLACRHCYSQSNSLSSVPDELTTQEGKALIDDLAGFGAPVLLLSGGEPLMRADLFDLAAHATASGLRCALSSNGTLITRETAAKLKHAGISYVGVSFDGLERTHDRFRSRKGAFAEALAGIRACRDAGIKAGIRFTITKSNAHDVSGIFDLAAKEHIPRICFYHLVYAGRGSAMMREDLDSGAKRRVVDMIIGRTVAMRKRGLYVEVLTVDNHCDGPYLYLRMLRESHADARTALELLRAAGNSTGTGIGCVSWDGTVYPDQFWRTQPVGNIREKQFSRIWTDRSHPLLAALGDKRRHVKGRCRTCRFLDACGGNSRARGEAATGDEWGYDPACYLTDEEIREPKS